MRQSLTREQTIIMRGIAIILIALHNYSHCLEFAIEENEFSYSSGNALDFFHQISVFSEIWVYNLFSFLGWYGVPVFVFLTAYGLVRKYETNASPLLDKKNFLYKNWLKLFALMVPAVLFFISFNILRWVAGSHIGMSYILSYLFSLTFLNDLLFPLIPPNPFIYWYLGLTLELYFIYAWLIFSRSVKPLLIMTVISILLQWAVMPSAWNSNNDLYLEWVRLNATGWMLPFAFGIIFARIKPQSFWIIALSAVAALILIFPAMLNPWLWHISLLCAVLIIMGAALLTDRIPYWRKLWIWIGKLSPFIYMAHPIVRMLIFRYFPSLLTDSHIHFLLLYLVTTLICALVYRTVWKWLTPKVEQLLPSEISRNTK